MKKKWIYIIAIVVAMAIIYLAARSNVVIKTVKPDSEEVYEGSQ